MTMEDWAARLDAFLALDDRDVLQGSGSVTKKQADAHALSEFERFRIVQDREYVSDFDRLTRGLTQGNAEEQRGLAQEGEQ